VWFSEEGARAENRNGAVRVARGRSGPAIAHKKGREIFVSERRHRASERKLTRRGGVREDWGGKIIIAT